MKRVCFNKKSGGEVPCPNDFAFSLYNYSYKKSMPQVSVFSSIIRYLLVTKPPELTAAQFLVKYVLIYVPWS